MNVLRWAIGMRDGLRSSTWRLWGNKKGDIYVAVRGLGGITKASFHRDGRCQVGFTEEYLAIASRRFGIESRHWEKWRLPEEPVVRIVHILVPRSELRYFADRRHDGVIWLPAPPHGSVGEVSVLLSAADIEVALPAGRHEATIAGKIRTLTRTAWLVYDHNPIDPKLNNLIENERTKLAAIPGSPWPPGTRVTLWESREDHDRHVLELAC